MKPNVSFHGFLIAWLVIFIIVSLLMLLAAYYLLQPSLTPIGNAQALLLGKPESGWSQLK